MKALFFTLLLFGGAFLAYDYFGAPAGAKMVFTSLNTPAPAAPASPSAEPAPGPEKPAAPVKPAPVQVASVPPATPPAQAMPAPDAAPVKTTGFVPPRFETLDTLTKGWTVIPRSAFPRQVKLTKDTPFAMSVGSATIKAGTKVTALGFDNGRLTLAPNAASAARAQAAVDDTDIKAGLAAGYEEWKSDRIAAAKQAYDTRQSQPTAAATASTAPAAGSIDAAGRPVRGPDGTFPVLVGSLKSGEVTEIKLANIRHWDDPQPTMLDGRPGWSIKVQVDVETVFGLEPAEAQALVRDGKVRGWYYTGSGEQVP